MAADVSTLIAQEPKDMGLLQYENACENIQVSIDDRLIDQFADWFMAN